MKKLRLSKKGKRLIAIGGVILLLILAIVFIFSMNKGKKNNVEKEIGKEVKEEVVEEKKIQIINLDSNSRNIAVMINNIKNVWGYQSGLQDAYLVYEMIVEGGFTRLMAIYKDQTTERIGSVRSARPYYLDYALENDALYIHFGGSEQALSEIKSFGIQDIDFLSSAGYWRDKSLKLATEHTAFTSMEKIKEQVEKRGYRVTSEEKPVLNYSADEIDLSKEEGSIVANQVYIAYSSNRNTSFTYDSEQKVYKRSQNGKEHTDYVTKEQYTAKNIITYQVENYSLDSYGRQALKNIGSGTGYFITNGYARQITWEKKDRSSKTVYKYLNGEEVKVNDGNTYIEIQPKDKTLTIE